MVSEVVQNYIMEYDATTEKNEVAPFDMERSLEYIV